tara:strand:+ start:976 stop:2097 length:1122 start_codon:yes stop_codon:yes gene_type:complete
MKLMILPNLGVNDEEATITWEIENKTLVNKGQVIAIAETTKATVEIQAESEGYAYLLIPKEESIQVGKPIVLFGESEDLSDQEINKFVEKSKETENLSVEKKWTQKAVLLAEAKGINIQDVPCKGNRVKESDVVEYLSSLDTNNELKHIDIFEMFKSSRIQRVLLLGGGRGAIVLLDAIQTIPELCVVGIIDDNTELQGKSIAGVKIIGQVTDVQKLWDNGVFDFAVVAMSNARKYRREIFENLKTNGIPFTNIIHPSVKIHSYTNLGQGNVILANCRIGVCTTIGDNNFLSTNVNIEHHNNLGSHCTFGPYFSTSSRVTIGDYVKFGTGIFVEPGVTIGHNSIVASGSILVDSVPPNTLVKTKLNYTMSTMK